MTDSKDARHTPTPMDPYCICDWCQHKNVPGTNEPCNSCAVVTCLSRRIKFQASDSVVHAINAHAALEASNTHLKGSVVKLFKGRRDARKERDRLREALEDLLNDAIILSDDYLDTFKDRDDGEALRGWDIARWRRLSQTAKKARAALAPPGPEKEAKE